MLTLAEKLCITAAFIFFMTGLLTGIWKYRCMAASANASAPVYVNVAHRSSLMYAFAALLLAYFAKLSVFPELTNTLAAVAALAFFAFAIATYIVHGVLDDTSNQLRKPHRLGKRRLPGWLTPLFMVSLIVAEVGGAAVLGTGALLAIW
ncbi:hypothetical protein [Marinobacter sp. SS21]|uniref:hypothetical protein n=1 Tax=Marinobacter sp. SS21 TaxID=2979460 RepID=UPI00232B329A|nr:hypothetical protein [Marinobacter sp. SS21]MDC0663694.1 hypothetical protein [Marinobacter sp. SS21]